MIAPQQMEFASVAFPKDRTVLYVAEVAHALSITEQHVSDLIEEGKLQAIDISGGAACAEAFVAELARRLKTDVETVRGALAATRAQTNRSRRYWRIPIEAYKAFVKENHSFHLAS